MTNQPNTKPAGSLPTRWELRTYDVWGNARDGYEVNDVYSAGEVELRIPQTRYNVGAPPILCPDGVKCQREDDLPTDAYHPFAKHYHSAEWVGASPSDRQIKRAFGVTCRIETDGDDVHIEVTRARDGYPIGEMYCTSHESLSPVRAREYAEVK